MLEKQSHYLAFTLINKLNWLPIHFFNYDIAKSIKTKVKLNVFNVILKYFNGNSGVNKCNFTPNCEQNLKTQATEAGLLHQLTIKN